MDEKTCKPLLPLVQAQAGVRETKLVEGIKSYECGGQPWHFDLNPEEHDNRYFIHLGMRHFPNRQITLETFTEASIQLEVEPDRLAETPCFVVPKLPSANRVVLHGTGICHHNRQTPALWRFLATIRKELEERFDEIVFVGSDDDREVGTHVYAWESWNDHGDFLTLASYLQASKLVIACGSSVAALAGALKVPAIRVHDDIGGLPKVTWSNLGSSQLNATELELRTKWPEFRDQWLNKEVK